MDNKMFKLWIGCFGNGLTVCNEAVEVNGDYKTVAHISNAGNIKLYVKESYIPREDMEWIKEVAQNNKKNFIAKLKADIKANPSMIYRKMLEELSTAEFCEFTKKSDGLSIADKIKILIPIYLNKN